MYPKQYSRRSNALAPFSVFCLFVVFLFFLAIALILGIYYGKLNAKNDFVPLDVNSETETSSADNSDKAEASDVVVEQNGIRYVSVGDLGAEITMLDETIYQVNFDASNQFVFCTQTLDYFHNNQLSFLDTAPVVSENKLLIPVSASLFGFTQTEVRDLTLQAVTVASASPVLPNSCTVLNYFKEILATPVFQSDLSAYEPYLNPEDRDGYLILLNAEHGVDKDYRPENLIPVERARYSGNDRATMQEIAAKALDAFLKEAYAVGHNDITVTTAYRSYSNQESRFNYKVSTIQAADPSLSLEEAQKEAARYIQWPGKSEHQTGLACDMHNLPAASTDFGGTPEADWLAENAHHFGFILRYPADKTEITGITYEPWHFRYVGRYHATRMFLLNLTLEEYTDFLALTGEAV